MKIFPSATLQLELASIKDTSIIEGIFVESLDKVSTTLCQKLVSTLSKVSEHLWYVSQGHILKFEKPAHSVKLLLLQLNLKHHM